MIKFTEQWNTIIYNKINIIQYNSKLNKIVNYEKYNTINYNNYNTINNNNDNNNNNKYTECIVSDKSSCPPHGGTVSPLYRNR